MVYRSWQDRAVIFLGGMAKEASLGTTVAILTTPGYIMRRSVPKSDRRAGDGAMDRRVGVERIAAEFRRAAAPDGRQGPAEGSAPPGVLRPSRPDRPDQRGRRHQHFSSSLFKKLHEYGEIEVGKFAVCVILESIRGEVGLKDRERIKEILHVYPRSRLGESFETRGRMLKKVRTIWITGFLE